jgi:hypothetical protein
MILCKVYGVSDNLKEPAFSFIHLPVLRNGSAGRCCRLDDLKNIKIAYPYVCFSVIIATAISVTITVKR